MNRKLPFLLGAAVVLSGLGTGVHADEASRPEARVPLSAETWVATTTAEVEVVADVTLVDVSPDAARADVMGQIASLVPDARWRITGFERGSDSSGAQRWTIRAVSRVDQAHLDALQKAVRSASRPGRQLRVGRIDAAPSLKEREAAMRALRAEIYQAALEEREVAKVLWPNREVAVVRVEFQGLGIASRPQLMQGTRADMAEASAPDGLSSERRLVLRAWVTLAPLGTH